MSFQGSLQSSLNRQIEEEIQREAEIDKRIENIKKRFLKQQASKKYRIIPTKKDADAVLLFNRSDLRNYNIVLCKENNEFIEMCDNESTITTIFLKNKNPHDAKASTYGDIRKTNPKKKNY